MLQTCSMGLMKMSSAGGTKLWREDPRDWIGQESSMWKEQSSALRRAIFKPQPQFDASAAISRHDSVNIRPAFCGHRISICTTSSQSRILEVLRCHHHLPTKPPLKLRSYERPCHSKPTFLSAPPPAPKMPAFNKAKYIASLPVASAIRRFSEKSDFPGQPVQPRLEDLQKLQPATSTSLQSWPTAEENLGLAATGSLLGGAASSQIP